LAEATKALERRMLCGVGFAAYLRFLPAEDLLDFVVAFLLLELVCFPELVAGGAFFFVLL
jgi:hypothetical protein